MNTLFSRTVYSAYRKKKEHYILTNMILSAAQSIVYESKRLSIILGHDHILSNEQPLQPHILRLARNT